MSTKYQNYITDDDGNLAFYDAVYNWNAMTFTPAINHIATSVKVKLLRYASSVPGILTAWLLATSGGAPTGSALATGTCPAITANAITTTSPGEWIEITFAAGALMLLGTVYGLALKSSTDDTSKPIYWRIDNSASAYTGGRKYTSSDQGATWDAGGSGEDFMFEIWGDPQGSGEGGVIHPSDDVARVSSIRHIFRPGFFRMQVGLGDLGFDIDVAETSVRRELDTAKEAERPGYPEILEKLGMTAEEFAKMGLDIARARRVSASFGAGYEAQIEYEEWFQKQMKELEEMRG